MSEATATGPGVTAGPPVIPTIPAQADATMGFVEYVAHWRLKYATSRRRIPDAIQERWQSRVIGRGLERLGERGARAYLENWGRSIGAVKCRDLAIVAEREGYVPFAAPMWAKAYVLDTHQVGDTTLLRATPGAMTAPPVPQTSVSQTEPPATPRVEPVLPSLSYTHELYVVACPERAVAIAAPDAHGQLVPCGSAMVPDSVRAAVLSAVQRDGSALVLVEHRGLDDAGQLVDATVLSMRP